MAGDFSDDMRLSPNTLSDIRRNITHISVILNSNLVFTSRTLGRLISEELWQRIEESSDASVAAGLKALKGDDVIARIQAAPFDEKGVSYYSGPIFCGDGEPSMDSANWFLLLAGVIKSNFYNGEYDFYLVPRYFSQEQNIQIDLTPLFVDIVNPIVSDSGAYVRKFICFHFYSLLVSKVRNSHIRRLFDCVYDSATGRHKVLLKPATHEHEYSEEEFLSEIRRFLDSDECESFLAQEYPVTRSGEASGVVELDRCHIKAVIDFAEYMKFISSFRVPGADGVRLDILEPNFYSDWPIYGPSEKFGLFGQDGVIMAVAKELTDITLRIADVRSQIKAGIQQYSIVGTKRIATDILADFFIRNYSDHRDWGYVSDLSLKEFSDLSYGNYNFTEMLRPLSDLFDEEAPFSIDVTEYYDDTKYLNVESDMPDVVIGQTLKSVDEDVSWWVDSNGLIVSGLQPTRTYEDVYAPCSYFTSDYSERFWASRSFTVRRRARPRRRRGGVREE